MKNYIDKIRAAIKEDFHKKTFQKGDMETYLSLSKRFRLEATNFWLKGQNVDITQVKICDEGLNQKSI
jgi:hypothetical protein